jgi:hypothetical protein
MSSIIDIHRIVRLVVLLLLVVAVLGPWAYSSDGVPPPEWCAEPNILLTPERCVRLIPGTEILSLLGSFFVALPAMLFSREFSLLERGRELLFVFLLTLLFLPLISTLSLFLTRTTRRLLVFDLAAWGLAAVPAVYIAFFTTEQHPLQLWGVWLFVGLGAAMLLLGAWLLIKHGQALTQPPPASLPG